MRRNRFVQNASSNASRQILTAFRQASMRPAFSHARLPPELWIRVFDWATYTSARDYCDLLDVPLFDGIAYREDRAQIKEAFQTKTTLVLVCKQWRAISEEYLYEDLRIRHGKRILAEVLERSRFEHPQTLGVGRHVRRIVLPNTQDKSAGYGHSRHWADEDASRIIRCCPNLAVLSRYHSIFIRERNSPLEESDSGPRDTPKNCECCDIYDPPLRSIRRLDWFNGEVNDPGRPTICAVPSSLWSAQQLETLTLSGDNYFWGPHELQCLSGRVVLLHNVRTLRVGSIHAFGVPGVSGYILALPALRRIILDRGEALHRLIECVVAAAPKSDDIPVLPDVTTLEVGSPHWRFTRSDYISTLIRHYSSAESLYYPVFFVRPLRWRRLRDNGLSYGPPEAQKVFSNLRHVGLHAEPNPELCYPGENENAEAIWSHLYAHARALLGSTSPNLLESRLPGVRLITLYGLSWLPLIADIRFHTIFDLAETRGAQFIAEHPSVAIALQDALLGYRTSLLFNWSCGL